MPESVSVSVHDTVVLVDCCTVVVPVIGAENAAVGATVSTISVALVTCAATFPLRSVALASHR